MMATSFSLCYKKVEGINFAFPLQISSKSCMIRKGGKSLETKTNYEEEEINGT